MKMTRNHYFQVGYSKTTKIGKNHVTGIRWSGIDEHGMSIMFNEGTIPLTNIEERTVSGEADDIGIRK